MFTIRNIRKLIKIISDWVQGLSGPGLKREFKPGFEGRIRYSRQSTYTERSKGTEVRALEEATTPPAKAVLSCGRRMGLQR